MPKSRKSNATKNAQKTDTTSLLVSKGSPAKPNRIVRCFALVFAGFFDCKYGLESVAGKGNKNKDCWYIAINKKESMKKFSKQIGHYLRHKKRKEDLQKTMSFLSTLS